MSTTRILVAEDEHIVALDIKKSLEAQGYAVSGVVSSGERAIEKAAEMRPDLTLMDIRLRGKIDGVEAARQIRARFDTPVVYLTAHADDATLRRAKVAEPFGYILKPFEEIELRTTIEMALHKHSMELRLKESEQWLSTVLRGIGDAVIATDDRGFIRFMNPVAEGLTGWKQEEALGKDFGEIFHIIHEETGGRAESPVERVLREGEVVGLGDHILLVNRDGSEIPIGDSAAPIKDGEGIITGVVVVFRDISERVQAEQALRGYALELQARNEDLHAYARTVAHDLKVPLNPIIGFAEVLEKEHSALPNEDLKEYLRLIAQNGRKMANIIEELLLLAEVRTRQTQLGPLAMGSLVAEAQGRLAYLIEEYRAEITLPDNWPLAIGHGLWVEEVWVNYLSNGIKYGGQPPRLELGATEQSDGMVCFWVRDNGRGLTPEEQALLFAPFTQLSQVRATGHGLGLSIVRRIVEKLGGQVGVKSEVGQGSVFFFTLRQARG